MSPIEFVKRRLPKFGGDRRPLASTSAGLVRGTYKKKGTLVRYLGIPYAAPPVGERRWAPPEPVEPWSGTRSATKSGPMPFQRAANMEAFFDALVDGMGVSTAKKKALALGLKLPRPQSEDSLTLNVRAPARAKNLPVMVWIHGGDQTDGSGSDPFYNSSALPARGCVLVTINYRLGLFGWFSHPDLSAGAPAGVSGNYGLLDQIAALEWVRDNIASFGGDPTRVTIFGESAGGQGVLNLMTAPAARGLFHAAIAQSPSDSGRWLHLRKPVLDFLPAEVAGKRFADLVVGPEPGQLERLRAMDAEELHERYRAQPDLGRHFYPVVDGVVLPETPMTAFSNGHQAPVPLVVGYNADEASLFETVIHPAGGEFAAPDGGPGSLRPEDLRSTFERSFGSPEAVDRLLTLYPGLGSGDPEARVRYGGDHMFGVHVDHAARRHTECGHRAYRYHFEAVPPSPDQTIGAFHAAELTYVFGTSLPFMPRADDEHLLSKDMGDRWFAFAATGRPDFPGRPTWPAYDESNPAQMVFDRPTGRVEPIPAQPGLDLLRERIEYLNERVAATPEVDTSDLTIDLTGSPGAEAEPAR